MRQDQQRYRIFTRRAALLAGGKALLMSTLAGRMYYLQVLEAEKYAVLAEENRINIRLLPPPRGRILDRFGVPLAVNDQNYRVVIIAEQTPDIEVGQTRDYPYGGAAAHVVGYVAAVSEAELADADDPLLQLPGFRIGKVGVEKQYDEALRGSAGTSQVEVNAVGRVIRELSRDEGQPGQALALTIDMALQQYTQQRLATELSGSAVVLDIHSGDVLAMGSSPTFDPNAFNRGISWQVWEELISDPLRPLANKALAGQYAPGSTFKMIVALAALKAGIDPEERVLCPGYMTLGDSRFHCWKRYGHGFMDMVDGIKHSCDVYFYEISNRVGIDAIADMANRFGLGEAPGLGLPGENTGLIPRRDWKLTNIGEPWYSGETLVAGIGQGYIQTTPLQLAVMTARIANGGYAITPRLVRQGIAGAEPDPLAAETFPALGIPAGQMTLIREAMDQVTNDWRGTAYRARIEEPDMAMAGKTGTAQVRRITMSERQAGVRDNEDLPWRRRDHALFVGFAPVSAPSYAAAVVIEHGGGGSRIAAPIARDILIETQLRDPARRLRRRQVAEAESG